MWAGLRDLLLMNEMHWKWQCGKAKKGTGSSSWSFFSRDSSCHVLRTFKQPNAEFHIITNWGLQPTVIQTILEADFQPLRGQAFRLSDGQKMKMMTLVVIIPATSWVILSQNPSIQLSLIPDPYMRQQMYCFKPVSVRVLDFAAVYKQYTCIEHTVLPGLPTLTGVWIVIRRGSQQGEFSLCFPFAPGYGRVGSIQ